MLAHGDIFMLLAQSFMHDISRGQLETEEREIDEFVMANDPYVCPFFSYVQRSFFMTRLYRRCISCVGNSHSSN